MASSSDELLKRLTQRIREIETSERPHGDASLSLGIPSLEKIFPEERVPAGTLLELLTPEDGVGAFTLALWMARHACGTGRILVIADAERRFYPPAAARLGVDLRRTVVIRPRERGHVVAALVQTLRCNAVGAVLGKLETLSSVDGRRLQLAAEAGGNVGFLLRPQSALRFPSFASLRLTVAPALSDGARRVRVEAAHVRGGRPGQSLLLEIHDDAHSVYVSAPLAGAAPVARPARASG